VEEDSDATLGQFQDLYCEHFERLRRLSDRILHDAAEAEDVAQETLLRAWLRRDSLGGVEVGAWLTIVARNLSLTRYRAKRRSVALENEESFHDAASDPSLATDIRARRRAIETALSRLTPRHREALLAEYVEGLPREALAEHLGIRSGALRAVMFRARETLKKELLAVREQLWGIAIGIRVRWDRVTRRTSADGGVVEASRAAALQSGVSVATVVLLAAVSLTGVGSSFHNADAGGGAAFRPGRARALRLSKPADSAPGGSAASGIGGGSSGTTYRFGPASHTFDGEDSTTHVGVPAPADKQHREILGIDVEMWESDEETPMDRRYERLSDQACSALPPICWSSSAGGAA
jgi:RNA polymerase sigma factor (sigma-70 family)